ncbi:5934_t:CDS:2 [Entrophospora sp. SA101]|nr:5934_t:CDS:2 [Entrophospora sp. SA101]
MGTAANLQTLIFNSSFPSNQINNSSFPSSSSRSSIKKALNKRKGRQFSYVWNYFKMTGHDHYEATCNFCKRVWNRGNPKRMAAHLPNNCLQVPHDIHNTVLNACLKEYGSSPLDESSNDDYDNDNNGNQITKRPKSVAGSTLHVL